MKLSLAVLLFSTALGSFGFVAACGSAGRAMDGTAMSVVRSTDGPARIASTSAMPARVTLTTEEMTILVELCE